MRVIFDEELKAVADDLDRMVQDVRKAINGAELLYTAGEQVDGVVTVTLEDAELVGQKSAEPES